MPIRILCLHGQGTSASIFRKQTEHMRKMLPADYQFYFFDGRHKCEADQEVLDFFLPPYWAWYSTPTTHSVLGAHGQVLSIIREHGEFDAVIGFSQGAAVAASLLLHQELLGEEPVFKAAIFIGSPLPFSHRLDVGIDCSTGTSYGIGDEPRNAYGRPTTIPPHLLTDPTKLDTPMQSQGSEDTCSEAAQYQMFHADVDGVRIQVPTGHIYGSEDKWFFHSQELVRLCRADVSTVFQHMGGHEVPRAYTEEICDVIEAVFSRIGE
ncbi:serine hydrolase FSH [Xylaria arbuscula]|nr:serine hydrolase FSH [Xylaria arbuscula]